MNALIEQFDLLATSTGGIAKLRELILSLAVRGQLVPQDPSDEPASELLKKIRTEKDRLIAEKVIRKGKPLPKIEEYEQFFELPHQWEWIRLGEIGDWGAGATPPRGNAAYYGGTIPWFKSGELTADFISESEETVTEDALRDCSLRANKAGDVLVAMYGATIGKTAILSVPATTNQAVCACTPYAGFENRYLLLLMKALKPHFISQGAGGAQPNISREKIIATVAGLPPTAEQSRIVAKVEELMALCDRLEAEQGHAARVQGHWVEAALDQLAESADADEFRRHWQHLAEHFDTLFTTPASIERLNATLLQLAVRGKLVAQDPNDEPASELLKQIRTEKDRLIAEGKIKRDKPLAPITDEEKPWVLPKGWEWVRVSEAFNTTSGSTFDAALERESGAIPYVKVGDMNLPGNELVITTSSRFIDPVGKMESFLIPEGSVIFPKRGGAIATNKKRIVSRPIFVDLNTMAICPTRGVKTEYAYLWLSTIDLASLNTGTSVPQINHKDIDPLPFPLPPVDAQSRIVAQVEELLALTAVLKTRLAAAQTKQVHLAEVLIQEALIA